MLAARAGDREAFGRLYRRYSRAVFLELAARLRGRHDAEDALQATFLAAWTNLPRLRRPSRFIGWLFTWGFASLVWWKILLGIIAWPYFLGEAARLMQ